MALRAQPTAFTQREAEARGLVDLGPALDAHEEPITVEAVAAAARVDAVRTLLRFDPIARAVFGPEVLERRHVRPNARHVVRLRGELRPVAIAQTYAACTAFSEPDPQDPRRRIVRGLSLSILGRALGYRVHRGRCATVSAHLAELRAVGLLPWTIDLERQNGQTVRSNQPARHVEAVARGRCMSHRVHRGRGAATHARPRTPIEALRHAQEHQRCADEASCCRSGCTCGRPWAIAVRTIVRDVELLPPAS